MTTINWIIESLLVRKVEGSNTDVVITADWRCNGTDGTYSGTCYGSASFAPPTGSFTPYDQLTQDQVLGWCFANGGDVKHGEEKNWRILFRCLPLVYNGWQ